jgi:hypothetical protein
MGYGGARIGQDCFTGRTKEKQKWEEKDGGLQVGEDGPQHALCACDQT